MAKTNHFGALAAAAGELVAVGLLVYAVSCKIMYVTARHMPCMHLIPGFWVASSTPQTGLFKILQTNFREFLFHALR
jgi:hypothetical protein